MADIRKALEAVVTRILEGAGHAPHAQRRAAFDNEAQGEPLATFVRKLTKRASEINDEDFAAVRAAGLSEDQIFELVVCAAIGHANRQHELAVAALESIAKE